MRTKRISLIVVAIVVAIVLVASCGGSSSKAADPAPTTAPAAPSSSVPKARAAYIVSANAICQALNAKINQLANPGSSATSEAAVTDQAARLLADALRKLRRIRVPAGEQAAVRAMYAKVDAVLANAPKLSAALRGDDQAAGQRVQVRLQDATRAANDALEAYGLHTCAT